MSKTESDRKAKRQKTGGRAKGVRNKATGEIKELARVYVPAALKELARLSIEAESEQARVSAIKEILDRAYGKAAQPLGNDPENPLPTGIVISLIKPNAD